MQALPYGERSLKDFGFGTAYERVAVYQKVDFLLQSWPEVKTGVEGFYDGFSGIPGMHLLPLARRGGKVSVACPSSRHAEVVKEIYAVAGLSDFLETAIGNTADAFPGKKFDVVLLFAPFPYLEDWQGFARQSLSPVDRYAIVSTGNSLSYGAVFRRGIKMLDGGSDWDRFFDHPSTKGQEMERLLSEWGHIVSRDYWDCPWWPDLSDGAGDSVASWIVSRVFRMKEVAARMCEKKRQTPATSLVYGAENFPYPKDFCGTAELRDLMARHPGFDHQFPGFVKTFFGHHRLFIVKKK